MWEIQVNSDGWKCVQNDIWNYQDAITAMQSWRKDNPGIAYRVQPQFVETDELPYDIVIRLLQ